MNKIIKKIYNTIMPSLIFLTSILLMIYLSIPPYIALSSSVTILLTTILLEEILNKKNTHPITKEVPRQEIKKETYKPLVLPKSRCKTKTKKRIKTR